MNSNTGISDNNRMNVDAIYHEYCECYFFLQENDSDLNFMWPRIERK